MEARYSPPPTKPDKSQVAPDELGSLPDLEPSDTDEVLDYIDRQAELERLQLEQELLIRRFGALDATGYRYWWGSSKNRLTDATPTAILDIGSIAWAATRVYAERGSGSRREKAAKRTSRNVNVEVQGEHIRVSYIGTNDIRYIYLALSREGTSQLAFAARATALRRIASIPANGPDPTKGGSKLSRIFKVRLDKQAKVLHLGMSEAKIMHNVETVPEDELGAPVSACARVHSAKLVAALSRVTFIRTDQEDPLALLGNNILIGASDFSLKIPVEGFEGEEMFVKVSTLKAIRSLFRHSDCELELSSSTTHYSIHGDSREVRWPRLENSPFRPPEGETVLAMRIVEDRSMKDLETNPSLLEALSVVNVSGDNTVDVEFDTANGKLRFQGSELIVTPLSLEEGDTPLVREPVSSLNKIELPLDGEFIVHRDRFDGVRVRISRLLEARRMTGRPYVVSILIVRGRKFLVLESAGSNPMVAYLPDINVHGSLGLPSLRPIRSRDR